MSLMQDYDCVVIGAGVQGSFAAYQLAKQKKKTLLLEQTNWRSKYTKAFIPSFQNGTFISPHRQTGLLVMGPEHSGDYQLFKNTLQRNKVPTVILTRDNFPQHIPNVILAEGDGALVDVTAGELFADRALKAVQFQKLGGVIRDNEKVMEINPGPVVKVTTSGGVYQARSVVITAGPWTNKLLAHTGFQLPLEVVKINVCYWKERAPGTYDVKQRFPCFLVTESVETKEHIYGLPSNEYPGLVKICYHMGSKTDPDYRDLQTDKSDIDILKRYVARSMPGLIPEPAVVESCMYTLTPDRHFVLDYHPNYSNIIIGAGFSGHGFKFGPVIGKLLCELCLGEVPSFDVSPFRIRRFQSNTKSAL
uniref:Pipecolic acid oxidase n=1 Tax=Fundulus heteroclitus TaxID=8078 RepID=A0A3Q2STH9_FUNHE